MRFPCLTFLFVALAASVAAARDFVPGEVVWCAPHGGYVEAPHECDKGAGPVEFCPRCEGYFADSPHVHVEPYLSGRDSGPAPAAAAPEPVRPDPASARPGAPAAATGPDGDEPLDETLDAVKAAAAKHGHWLLGGAAAVVLLSFVLSLRKNRRRTGFSAFVFKKGTPQGLELVPGSLVCEETPAFDGGTATVHYALWRSGRRWVPAFVKRMVGAGMRRDARLPALRFESEVLRRLDGAGIAPKLFVPAAEIARPGGDPWICYAMGVAQGRPWPGRGGLGKANKAALHALCEALVTLHDKGFGHHDLKPQNIFWNASRGEVTLLDFGAAIDHGGGASALLNPLGGQMAGTEPWVPPASDGRCLADLSTASDAWVYGLLFCEALVGGVHDADRTRRRTPEKPEDREWFRESLAREVSPKVADAVVDGLFALQRSRRMALRDFLAVLRSEWEV